VKPNVLLVGCGGHAMACIDVIEQEGRRAIAGLIGQRHEVGREVLGYPVVASDDELVDHLQTVHSALVAVGQIKTPEPRMRLFEQIVRFGTATSPIVSPRAYVSAHAWIGEGTIILHGAVVNAGARVGRNCIINSLALIEHEAEVHDHCHVATGARVNSAVVIGEGSFVGSGTVVRQGVRIGAGCVIGMGQRVLADCADGQWLPPRRNP
jgi:sugar O-acyltransferase (sialic acid O-acetyltransferase NeuD family)